MAVEKYLLVMNELLTYIEDFYSTLNFFCFSFYSANEEIYILVLFPSDLCFTRSEADLNYLLSQKWYNN